jgi:hypothetical protein
MYSAVSWATVLTALTPKRAVGRVWIARALVAVLVVLLAVLLFTGTFARFVSDDGSWAWLQILLLIAVVLTIGAAWVMVAGTIALGRLDRLPPYLGAVAFTVLSLPLILGGLAIGLLLGIYLLLEDAPTGFKALRERRKKTKDPDAPRAERREAAQAAQALDVGAASAAIEVPQP